VQQAIKALKENIKYRDVKIINFNSLMNSKSETQQQYLVDMLQKAFDSGYKNQNHYFFKLMINTVENLVNKNTVNNYRYSEEIIH